LANATRYLKYAANSANYSYGDDVYEWFDEIDSYGDMITYEEFTPNLLTEDINKLKAELDKLSMTLSENAAK
jgi:hypothetical protein